MERIVLLKYKSENNFGANNYVKHLKLLEC